ncbi:MAG: hypothetical protein NZ805_14565 [Armatimonadetes bacterium]|nr:hypothetical protein [Armatimonadota bacterium]MDW8027625.1 hypothetical protein [Armatimonadota bacterium]
MASSDRVAIHLPLEALLDIIEQLPEDALRTVKRKVDERLSHITSQLPAAINDPLNEFWFSELGRMILQEADESTNIDEVRKTLSKLSGSLAVDIQEERSER